MGRLIAYLAVMTRFSKILVAEDDFADYLFFAEALEKISGEYNITHVKNGLECMTALKNPDKPDVIFLDLNMPGYNGLYCLKFMKNKEEFAGIPVIIYSTSHYIKDIDAAFKNEAHYYIVKPASVDTLVQMLKQVMTSLNERAERPCKNNFVVRVTATLEN